MKVKALALCNTKGEFVTIEIVQESKMDGVVETSYSLLSREIPHIYSLDTKHSEIWKTYDNYPFLKIKFTAKDFCLKEVEIELTSNKEEEESIKKTCCDCGKVIRVEKTIYHF